MICLGLEIPKNELTNRILLEIFSRAAAARMSFKAKKKIWKESRFSISASSHIEINYKTTQQYLDYCGFHSESRLEKCTFIYYLC